MPRTGRPPGVGVPPSAESKVIVAQLAILRENAGLSQHEVARRAGRALSAIRSWETGEANPSLSAVTAWAGALGYEVALLPIETTPTEETR